MDLGIRGRVAIVGGASRGLGRASAEALAQEGVSLMLCARTPESLEQAAKEFHQATGVEVRTYAGDLSQPDVINGLVQATMDHYGRLDILVSNIGGPPPGSAESVEEEALDIAIQRTYLFFIRMARASLPPMKAQRWGRIISILSASIKEPAENLVLSTSARLGAAGFLKALALEVAPHNVTVNNVLPGAILTQRQHELAEAQRERTGLGVEEILESRARAVPMKRIGTPEELGALVAFLASEQASYITGASVLVDGGSTRAIL
ncbi:MAG: SDR family oxidoreductase [Dehalococcoidia bacterium]|nr:SDR family oxidoreductase [Dehalococcoidia bacterium]